MPCTVGVAKRDGKPFQVYMNMHCEGEEHPRLVVVTPDFALKLSRLLAETARDAAMANLESASPLAN